MESEQKTLEQKREEMTRESWIKNVMLVMGVDRETAERQYNRIHPDWRERFFGQVDEFRKAIEEWSVERNSLTSEIEALKASNAELVKVMNDTVSYFDLKFRPSIQNTEIYKSLKELLNKHKA